MSPLTGTAMHTPFDFMFSSWKDQDVPLLYSIQGSDRMIVGMRATNVFESVKLAGSGALRVWGSVSDAYQATATVQLDAPSLTAGEYSLEAAGKQFCQ